MNPEHEQSVENRALADKLTALEGRTATVTAEGRLLADRILQRDRRRAQMLTGTMIVLFLVAIVGIYWNFQLAKADIYSKIWECQDEMFAHGQDVTPAELRVLRLLQDSYTIQFRSILSVSVAFAAILIASACTILLIAASRRATLRQIQASLLALSEQIKTMQESTRTKPLPDATTENSNSG